MSDNATARVTVHRVYHPESLAAQIRTEVTREVARAFAEYLKAQHAAAQQNSPPPIARRWWEFLEMKNLIRLLALLPSIALAQVWPYFAPGGDLAPPPTSTAVSQTIAAGVVSNSKLASMANGTLKCNASGSTGAPQDCDALTVQVIAAYMVAVNYSSVAAVASLSGVQNITLPSQSIISPVNGDSVLLTAQSTASQNGPWIVNTSGAWTRPTNYFVSGSVIPSLCAISVTDKTTNARYTLDTTGGAITVDTTSQSWVANGSLYQVGTAAVNIFGGDNAGGTGGALTMRAGNGTRTSGTNSAGGSLSVLAGSGSTLGATANTSGGAATLSGGAGGTGSNGTGGTLTLSGGAANGTSSTTASGGAVTINGGAAGATASTTAAGGAVNINGGAGGAGANGNGGTITLKPGAAGGSGTAGTTVIKDAANAAQITVNASGTLLGSATGGAQGSGTLNAQALYVNGVAVSAGGGATQKVKTSATTRTSTTSPTNDPDLQFTSVSTGTHSLQCYLFITVGATGSTPGFKVAVTLPTQSGITPQFMAQGVSNGANQVAFGNADGTGFQLTTSGSTSGYFLTVGMNNASTGTVAIQWAQQTSSSTSTTLNDTSYCILN